MPISNLVADRQAIDPAAVDTDRSWWIAAALRRPTECFADHEPLVRVLGGSTARRT